MRVCRRRRVYSSGCHGDLDSAALGHVDASDALRSAADVRLAARADVADHRQTATERRTGTGNAAVYDVTAARRRRHRREVVQR